MKLLLKIYLLLVCLALSSQAAETNSTAADQTNSPAVRVQGTLLPAQAIGRAVKGLFQRERQIKTAGTVAVYDTPTSGIVELMGDKMQRGISCVRNDRGSAEDFHDTVFVVIDPDNPKAFNKADEDLYVAGLCALALGNEASVLILDLTDFKPEDKEKLKALMIAQLKSKSGDARDTDGKKLDYDMLFKEDQINTVAFIAEDASKPKERTPDNFFETAQRGELTPIHSLDARYDDKVGVLMDKAQTTFLSWHPERRKDDTPTNATNQPVNEKK